MNAVRLVTRRVEKPWGRRDLLPAFGGVPDGGEPVGEIWYTFETNPITNGPLAGRTLGSLMEEYGPRLMGRGHRPSQLVRRAAGSLARSPPAGRTAGEGA